MFDFILKRIKKPKPAAAPANTVLPAPAVKPALDEQKQAARQAAMDKAGALHDEAAAIEFILQCEFADARFKAAERVETPAGLEQVYKAMRNTDRRVARSVQARLESHKRQAALQAKVAECVQQARRLADQANCPLSEVVLLDRKWRELGNVEPDLANEFIQARDQIALRLQAQTALQRAVIDTTSALQALIVADQPGDAVQTVENISRLELRMSEYRASPEAASVPKNLWVEMEQELERAQQWRRQYEQQQSALQARQDMLAQWESQPVEALERNALHCSWRALSPLNHAGMSALQGRFDALIKRLDDAARPAIAPEKKPAPQQTADLAADVPQVADSTEQVSDEALLPSTPAARQAFADALDAMEKALEEGAVIAASEHDRALRSPELKNVQPTPKQAARMNNARRELARLQDWARWGGKVSREELIEEAEALPGKNLAVEELAKSVGSFRAVWRTLDATSGAASKTLWERFDAACNVAYAPAAEHFRQLAEQRQQNAAALQAMIEEITSFAAQHLGAGPENTAVTPDWKSIAQFCQRTSQAWQRIGLVDRKERKRLQAEYDEAMQTLLEPLNRERSREIASREQLIAEVEGIDAQSPQAIDQVRASQQRWQQQAKGLPLERRDEQALWQRFRSACDAVFAQRKDMTQAADAERRGNETAKLALCQRLEAAEKQGQASQAEIDALLHEVGAAWKNSGPVPRASEQQIEERYRQARSALQQQRDILQRAALVAQYRLLQEKLALCQAVEHALRHPTSEAHRADWAERWESLGVLPADQEGRLRKRFNAGLEALHAQDERYLAKLEHHRLELANGLLELEILAGLDSPAELAAERLKMQVGVLQSALSSGRKAHAQQTELLRLCSLPALTEARDQARLARLIEKMSEA